MLMRAIEEMNVYFAEKVENRRAAPGESRHYRRIKRQPRLSDVHI
jgi:hypothetical protein